jgi:DNA-binding transcriptional regulator YiaG
MRKEPAINKLARLLLERQTYLRSTVNRVQRELGSNASDLAKVIKDSRDQIGLNNHDLAEATGLPYSSIVNWVYGNTLIPDDAAAKIIRVLKEKRKAMPRKPKRAP